MMPDFQSMPRWFSGAAAVLLSAVLYVISFPPFDVAEASYVFAVPMILWLFGRRSFRWAAVAVFCWGFLSWLVLIVWLRHVTWGGYFVVSAFLGVYFSAWFLAAWRILPWLRDGTVPRRLAGIVALAALWVVLEYIRSFFLSGFPWLPLAASHWQRHLLLQLASWTGSYGVGFVLIFFNLGFAFYIDRLARFYGQGWRRFCPEFFVGLALVLLAAFGSLQITLRQGGEREALFNVSFVQPYIPQDLKWDRTKAWDILDTIERTTLRTRDFPRRPDLVLWPEAVTPIPVLGDRVGQEWVERIAAAMEAPILLGSVGTEFGTADEWFNGAFAVDPEAGLLDHHYSKRKLVPFGEYVPMESVWPWISKIVPLEGSFRPGTAAGPIEVRIRGKNYLLGALICYEDVFPRLARETVREGAEILVVMTNNGWYGEEGMPFQHAAHSVLRAVETRRPVLRSGNGGWSGWIDEYGVIHEVLTDGNGSIFFRGGSVYPISRDMAWVGKESFYVRYGDWFVGLSGIWLVLYLCGIWRISRRRRARPLASSSRPQVVAAGKEG